MWINEISIVLETIKSELHLNMTVKYYIEPSAGHVKKRKAYTSFNAFFKFSPKFVYIPYGGFSVRSTRLGTTPTGISTKLSV